MKTHKTAPLIGPLLALALMMAALASCSGDTTTSTASPATTGAAPSTAPTATTATSSPPPLSDGEHFGFVRDVGERALAFDPAEFLSGEAALAAAREAGVIGQGEDLPNDFFISNPEAKTVNLTVDDAVLVTLIGLDQSGALTDTPVSFDELEGLWAGTADSTRLYGFVAGDLPVNVTVSGGVVVGAVQQYLP